MIMPDFMPTTPNQNPETEKPWKFVGKYRIAREGQTEGLVDRHGNPRRARKPRLTRPNQMRSSDD